MTSIQTIHTTAPGYVDQQMTTRHQLNQDGAQNHMHTEL